MNNERIDDLQVNGLKVIQKAGGFCFGIDAVLLANYINISKNSTAVDLCTGSGIVPILLTGKRGVQKVVGLEIQQAYAEMAVRSVSLNNLTDSIQIIHGDLRNASLLPYEFCDAVTCNPPYKEVNGGIISECDDLAIARHEIMCNLDDVTCAAARILKYGGKLCLIHKPERLAEIFTTMKKYNIEPKRLCMIHPYIHKAPNIVLVEGAKGGKPKLICDPPIIVYNNNGSYTDQINNIYGRNE